jgi:D-alanine-D-alanine ligase
LNFEASPSLDHLLSSAGDYNYVFSLLNRAAFRNSEVFVSSICEYFHTSYLGAPPNVRALAEDKYLTKVLAQNLGIPAPAGTVFRAGEDDLTPPAFPGPYILKPRFGAASWLIDESSVEDTWGPLKFRAKTLLSDGVDVLVERFIHGANVTIPVLVHDDVWVLPCMELVVDGCGGIVTYQQKRQLEGGLRRIPYEDSDAIHLLSQYAGLLYEAIWPVDYFRADFRVRTRDSVPFLLEINVCCNLGTHSNVATPARLIGLSQEDLVGHILAYSVRRQRTLG